MAQVANGEYITKTKVKEKFLLTEEDLTNSGLLGMRIGGNSIFYRKGEIISVAKDKFKVSSEEELTSVISKVKEEKVRMKIEKWNALKENRKKNTSKRANTLIKELKKLGIDEYTSPESFVMDQTSFNYVNGFTRGTSQQSTAKDVAFWLAQRKFLSEYTDYKDEVKKLGNPNTWNSLEFDPLDRMKKAEEIALNKIGGYPEVFPWQIKEKAKEEN